MVCVWCVCVCVCVCVCACVCVCVCITSVGGSYASTFSSFTRVYVGMSRSIICYQMFKVHIGMQNVVKVYKALIDS